jgi:hypothetical protein
MSFDVTTLALAKSYADQHGGGGGASTAGDFIIKMTVEGDGDGNYTVISCDATIEQIDTAVAAEKRVVVISTDTSSGFIFELPMIQGMQEEIYYFATFLDSQMISSFVQKIDESTSKWQFLITQIGAESVDYSNTALPNISTVGGALDELVSKSHTHYNKSVLDKFAETDGKPTYDGKEIGGDGASTAEKISYTSTDLPDVANVKTALDKVVKEQRGHGTDIEVINDMLGNLHKNSHTHVNKDTLDKLSDSNGKLQYNGSDVGLKGDKGDTGAAGADGYTPVRGTDYWTAALSAETIRSFG